MNAETIQHTNASVLNADLFILLWKCDIIVYTFVKFIHFS